MIKISASGLIAAHRLHRMHYSPYACLLNKATTNRIVQEITGLFVQIQIQLIFARECTELKIILVLFYIVDYIN